MIVRKPYAFLIRHFRLLHAILLSLLLFLTYRVLNIYSFFNAYAINHYYVSTGDLVGAYLHKFMFISIIVILILTIIIYYLLKLKNKKRKLYFFVIIFHILLFIFFIYLNNIFVNLEVKKLDFETIRIIRDLSLISLLFYLVFNIFFFGRALGFNIKQFEFKKDLQDMDISESDYEEVELILNNKGYKYKRFFRKIVRNIKYFIVENKGFFTAIASFCVLGFVSFILINFKANNTFYNQNEELFANTLKVIVGDAYLTNKNLNNIVINDDKYYLLVNINIVNNNSFAVSLDKSSFKLKVGDDIINFKSGLASSFMDINKVFMPIQIVSKSEEDFLVIFELKKSQLFDEYILKINNSNSTSIEDKDSSYKNVIVNPINLDIESSNKEYQIPSDINFDNNILFNSILKVNSYDIKSSFKESYEYCDNECYTGKYLVSPILANKESMIVLKVDSTLKLDSKAYINNSIKNIDDFYKFFGYLEYRVEGEAKIHKLNPLNIIYNKDKYSYFEVPKDIENANKIELVIQIRNEKYKIKFK